MKDQNQIQGFLKDSLCKEFLKLAILEKHQRYEAIICQRGIFLSKNLPPDSDEFSIWFVEQVFDRLLEGKELRGIEKDLSSMCFHLNRAEGKVSRITKWEEQYDYAKNQVRIKNVVQGYLRVDSFRRNIQCPFHEDKTASLKVYEDSNYFVCFGCGARGSPIDFVMKYENCSFKEAISIICNLFPI